MTELKTNKKTAVQILAEVTGIPEYRLKKDDSGEYITKKGAREAVQMALDQTPAIDIEKLFAKAEKNDGWEYTRNEVIDRIASLTVECPECESIRHSDEQYQCGTCGGGGTINVLNWMKEKIKNSINT